MELLIALALFLGLIMCWTVLPGSTSAVATPSDADTFDMNDMERQAGQPA